MPGIIISYRRSDSDVIAGRIRDRLVGHFGNESIYMDIDSIPFGLDFREHIKKALHQNDILLAIIGPNWLGQHDTSARIFDETDPVRIEVETALQRGIPVIPILVGGAVMPKPAELPDGLKDLAFRNAAIVDGGRDFHQHMDRLIRSTDKLLAEKSGLPGGDRSVSSDGATTAAAPGGDGAGVVARHSIKRANLRNWITAVLGIGFVAALGGLAYVVATKSPSSPPMSSPAAPIQQSTQQRAPQAEPTSTTVAQETMPEVPPPCNPANRSDVFLDDFKTHQIGWQPPVGADIPGGGRVTSYETGGLSLEVPVTRTFTELYTALIFGSVSACARIMNPSAIPDGDVQASAGIAFWVQDAGNAYTVSIFLQPASAQIYRNVNGAWLPMGMAASPLVKTAPSAINDLQVVTKGNYGAYYVNGKKLGEFKGQPPNKSFAGLIAQSGAARPIRWTFQNFSVYENQ